MALSRAWPSSAILGRILSVLCAFGMLFIVDLSEIAGTTKKRDEKTSLREMLIPSVVPLVPVYRFDYLLGEVHIGSYDLTQPI